jgi:hypothetical protein
MVLAKAGHDGRLTAIHPSFGSLHGAGTLR